MPDLHFIAVTTVANAPVFYLITYGVTNSSYDAINQGGKAILTASKQPELSNFYLATYSNLCKAYCNTRSLPIVINFVTANKVFPHLDSLHM